MSTAVVSTSAALGRPFLFDDDTEAEVRPEQVRPFLGAKKPVHTQESAIASIQSTIKNQQSTISLTPASQLEIRPAPEKASSGISALDALTGGLPRGGLTEVFSTAFSGCASAKAHHRRRFRHGGTETRRKQIQEPGAPFLASPLREKLGFS